MQKLTILPVDYVKSILIYNIPFEEIDVLGHFLRRWEIRSLKELKVGNNVRVTFSNWHPKGKDAITGILKNLRERPVMHLGKKTTMLRRVEIREQTLSMDFPQWAKLSCYKARKKLTFLKVPVDLLYCYKKCKDLKETPPRVENMVDITDVQGEKIVSAFEAFGECKNQYYLLMGILMYGDMESSAKIRMMRILKESFEIMAAMEEAVISRKMNLMLHRRVCLMISALKLIRSHIGKFRVFELAHSVAFAFRDIGSIFLYGKKTDCLF